MYFSQNQACFRSSLGGHNLCFIRLVQLVEVSNFLNIDCNVLKSYTIGCISVQFVSLIIVVLHIAMHAVITCCSRKAHLLFSEV